MNLFISMFNICYAKEEFDLCIGIWGIFLFFFFVVDISIGIFLFFFCGGRIWSFFLIM